MVQIIKDPTTIKNIWTWHSQGCILLQPFYMRNKYGMACVKIILIPQREIDLKNND